MVDIVPILYMRLLNDLSTTVQALFPLYTCPFRGCNFTVRERASLLRDPIYFRLTPLLNGQHTVDEIITCLHGQVSAIEALYALELLHHRGYVVEASPSVPSEQAAFWELLDINPQDAIKRLQETVVSVFTYGEIDITPLYAMLSALSVSVSTNGSYSIILTDDYLRDELDSFNREALVHARPWLLVKPVGTELWIRPLFVPGRTGCWACLAHRLQGARKVDNYLREQVGITQMPVLSIAALPSTVSTALSIAATETAKWIVRGQNESVEGRIVTGEQPSIPMIVCSIASGNSHSERNGTRMAHARPGFLSRSIPSKRSSGALFGR